MKTAKTNAPSFPRKRRRQSTRDAGSSCFQEITLHHLYYCGLAKLRTVEGRRVEAALLRQEYGRMRDRLGWELTTNLLAAHAIEGADWPTLGRLLREGEWRQWRRESREARNDHRGVLKLARWLAHRPRGSAL